MPLKIRDSERESLILEMQPKSTAYFRDTHGQNQPPLEA